MSNHSFDIHVATEYKSVEIAILVWHFQYWIMKNKRLNRNCIEGRTWTYQTNLEIAAAFPYFSIFQVERLIKKAVQLKILRKANYNKSQFDRTVWYAFEDEEKFGISRFREMEPAESINGDRGIAEPIPDTLPDALTDKDMSSLPFGRVASSFFDELKKGNPKVKKPNLKKWAKEFELLSKDGDGSTVEEIEKVIEYVWGTRAKASTNNFSWSTVIQSPNSLRKNFPRIWAEMNLIKTNKNEPIKNKETAESIAKKFPRNDIVTGPDYIEFINGMYSSHIKFEDKEFKQKCLSELNKRKLKIEKL